MKSVICYLLYRALIVACLIKDSGKSQLFFPYVDRSNLANASLFIGLLGFWMFCDFSVLPGWFFWLRPSPLCRNRLTISRLHVLPTSPTYFGTPFNCHDASFSGHIEASCFTSRTITPSQEMWRRAVLPNSNAVDFCFPMDNGDARVSMYVEVTLLKLSLSFERQ